MKISIFSKLFLTGLITTAFIFSPFANLKLLKVNAAQTWEWDKITDDGFALDNMLADNAVADTQHNLLYMHGNDMNIYEYNGESTILIDDDLPLDGTYIFTSMTFWNGKLYAAFTDYERPRVFSYDGSTWTEFENAIPREGTTSLVRLASISGLLVEWSLTDSARYIDVYGGFEWTNIAEPGDFGDLDLYSSELMDMTSSPDALYILLASQTYSEFTVWKFEWGGHSWTKVGDTLNEAYADIEYWDGTLFLGSNDNPSKISQLVINNWVPMVEDGFGNINNGKVNFTIYNNNLYATISNQGGNASLYRYRNNTWNLMSGFIGEDNPQPNSWVTSLIGYNDNLFIAVSKLGEGPYSAQGWIYTSANKTDFDGDGIPNSVEDSGPNNGDSGDGILDSREAEVVSFLNPVSRDREVLFTTCDYFDNVSFNSEQDNVKTDEAFDYPSGFINFNLHCTGSGGLVGIMLMGDYDQTLSVLRKYNSSTGTYSTINEARVNKVSSDPSIYFLTYALEDGGEYDSDGIVNGVIVDPVGIAVPTVSVPNTGVPMAHH